MADNYTHRCNANNALKISGYNPRNINAFIWGANGPDPLFCYQMYNPLRKYHLSKLATVMHNERTGLFLQNLFRMAATDRQKDYRLGFLCHYALDCTIHPYVNFVTSTYGSSYNIPSGHGYFESALDSMLSFNLTGNYAADYNAYRPRTEKMYMDQIVTLFKKAVDATYPEHNYPLIEYAKAFKDFRTIKKLFYSPSKSAFPVAYIVEKALGFSEGFVMSHMQPCNRPLQSFKIWYNEAVSLYSVESLENILARADQLAADNILLGLEYFKGIYNEDDLLEDIGNKSYETGITIDLT